jgi:enterochelin esterase-like enzyme
MPNRPSRPPRAPRAAALLIALAATTAGSPVLAAPASPSGPQVIHTGKGPTGYEVVFRYRNPAARRVLIKGEWSFARPSTLPRLAATPDHPVVEGQNLPPSQWRPGDFPLQFPNSTGPNFPISAMTRGKDGTWTWRTPLPSGTFTYGFIVDCDKPDPAQCQPVADPANLPWNERRPTGLSSRAPNSQVHVPSDPAFGTVDLAWQAPARVQGRLDHLQYPSPGHVAPATVNNLVVYTPPGYDPNRAAPYPTLWLSHGGGENELGWTTQGVAQNILDNLIATGEIEPMVVVMPNGAGYPDSDFNEAYDQDLITRMIPFVEARYHVARDPARRAFSGLSMGGMLTNSFIVKHPEAFGYFGMMSAGLPARIAALSPEQVAALRGKTVWIGGGWQDVIHAAGFRTTHTGPAREVSTLVASGVPVMTDFVNGGHEWSVWRQLLRDFLTRAAFHPAPYAAWPDRAAQTAPKTSAETSPAPAR